MKNRSAQPKCLPEHRHWWDIPVPYWVGIVFVLFCIAAAVYGTITVDDNPDDPIEYKMSIKSYDKYSISIFADGLTKKIYWRVKSSEVPRWNRLTNRWHKLHVTNVRSWNTKMVDTFTIDQYQELKKNYKTVGEIRAYESEQMAVYKQNNYKMRKKALIKESKKQWKNAGD